MTAWETSTAVFIRSLLIPGSTTAPHGIFFRDDGLKMYVNYNPNSPTAGTHSIREYNLSTPWNISTAVFLQQLPTSFLNMADGSSGGIYFKSDGTKFYVVGDSFDTVNEYTLTTPWNILTAVHPPVKFTVTSDVYTSINFRNDGLRMYLVGTTSDSIKQYNLSTPWSVSSAVFVTSFSVASKDTFPDGVFFKSDGTKMFVIGASSDSIHEYNLSTPWDISTAVFSKSRSVVAQDTDPTQIFFRQDGRKMYIQGFTNRRIYEYDLPITAKEIFVDSLLKREKKITIDARLTRAKTTKIDAFIVPEPTDTWAFREHKTITDPFNPTYVFTQESPAPKRFNMSNSGSTGLGAGYLFKSFPTSQITGSDIKISWIDTSPFFGQMRISVYDGTYDPNSQIDFPDASSGTTTITSKGAGLLGTINDPETGSTTFPRITTLPASSINYNASTTGFVTVFYIMSDLQQIPFSNIFFDFIDITKVAKFDLTNAQVTNVLTGTVRDWGYVGAGNVIQNVIKICDDISTSTGWIKVNTTAPAPGEMVFIDDPAFPDLIKLNGLLPGGGSIARYAYKGIGQSFSGNDIKLEFKVDYQSRVISSSFGPAWSIGFSETINHPQLQGVGKSSLRVDFIGIDPASCVMNGVATDGTTTKTTSSGAKNQHALWIYPNNNNPVSDNSLKGPYYVSLHLKNNKLRISAFKDASKTQHIRGSPITVDATGLNLNNLAYISVGNDIISGSGRAITCTVDDICVSQNLDPLEIIPNKPLPATGSFIESWEGYADGDQNPTPWISQTEIVGSATSLIDIHEVSSDAPVEGSKAFKLHQRIQRISGSPFGRVSVARFIPAIVKTDGSGLDIPLSLSAKMRADIIGQNSDPIGVMVAYELISGTPNLPTTQRAILFKLYGNTIISSYIWNGTEWVFNNTSDIPVSISLPATTVGEINSQNIKTIFDNSAILSNNNAWDFESHVTGVWVGYIGLNRASTTSEVLIHGDTISMLNAGVGIKTFSVGTTTKSSTLKTFSIDARLIKPARFTIDAHIPPVPKTPKIDARLVLRHAVNSAIVDAILAGTVTITTQTETFIVDGQIQQPLYQPFSIDAILINKRQKSFTIDMIITPLQEKTIKIDALVGLFEPQSILDVESVIGHDV